MQWGCSPDTHVCTCELFPGGPGLPVSVLWDSGLTARPPGWGHFAWCPALVPASGLTFVVMAGDLRGSTCGAAWPWGLCWGMLTASLWEALEAAPLPLHTLHLTPGGAAGRAQTRVWVRGANPAEGCLWTVTRWSGPGGTALLPAVVTSFSLGSWKGLWRQLVWLEWPGVEEARVSFGDQTGDMTHSPSAVTRRPLTSQLMTASHGRQLGGPHHVAFTILRLHVHGSQNREVCKMEI